MKKLLMLFRKYQWARIELGGRWLKKREAGYTWLPFDGSIMQTHGMKFPDSFPPDKFETESWTPALSSQESEGM